MSTDLFDGSETEAEDYEWDAFVPDPDEDSVNDDASLRADEAAELDLDDSEFDWEAALLEDPDSDLDSDADARVAAAFDRLERSADGPSTNGAHSSLTEGHSSLTEWEDVEVDPDEPELVLLPDSEMRADTPDVEAEADTEIEEPELILLPDPDEVVEPVRADTSSTLDYTDVSSSEFATAQEEEPPVEWDSAEPGFAWVETDESLRPGDEPELDQAFGVADVQAQSGELAANAALVEGGELETDGTSEVVTPEWQATDETEWEATSETEWEATSETEQQTAGPAEWVAADETEWQATDETEWQTAAGPEWVAADETEPIEDGLTMDAEITADGDLDADSERPSIDDEPLVAATTPLDAPAPPETEPEEGIHPEVEPSMDPEHALAHARTHGAGTRTHSRVFIASVVIAGLFLAAIGAAGIVRELHHTTGTSAGTPTEPAPTAPVPPATAQLQSATNEVNSATTTALVGLASLPTVPTPTIVAPVVNPYIASLRLYQTFLSEASLPAQARAAAAAVAAELQSDVPFFSSINGLPPASLGAYLQQFTRDVARLQTRLGSLEQALGSPSTP